MKKPLKNKLKALEYSSIKPCGWLNDVLQLQMNNITGILDEVWGSVGSYSDWIGGTENSWERPPYWLDGLVPLSFLLNDKHGIEKVKKWISWSMNSQKDNGDFGPTYRTSDFDETLFWPKFVMMKVFISYFEATHDERVIPFMTDYFRFCNDKLDSYKMESWAKARGGDFAYAVLWLYDRTKEDFLLELLEKVNKQTLNWSEMFEEFPFTQPTDYYYKWDKIWSDTTRESLYDIMQYHLTHIVNVSMGIKQPLMYYRASSEKRYLDAVYKGIKSLNRYHGQVSGIFAGDEHLSGNNPTQGTELCSVVEYMFSLQLLLEATGDAYFADILERVAYNALPAAISEDFKTHQYDQQANQVLVSIADRNWYNNGEDANIFGFEPNFSCCLANMHQGWPKFLKNAFLVDRNKVYAAVYMPAEVMVQLNGNKIRIKSETQYPFKGDVNFTLHMDCMNSFKFYLRIPSWCKKFDVSLNSEKVDYIRDGSWVIIDKDFNENDKIQILFDMPVEVKDGWYNNSVSVERGPLVFALKIKEKWCKLKRGLSNFPDYEIYPESEWNYALNLNEKMEVLENDISTKQPFSNDYSPVTIKAKAFLVPSWKIECNSAGELPVSPVKISETSKEVELIPYGSAKLRISLFPWAK